jgi:hypothetical protein
MRMMRVPAAWFEWFTVPRSLAVIGITAGGYCVLLLSAFRHGDLVGGTMLAQLAPLVAFVIALPLIALVGRYFGWIQERTLAPWQGNYYAFDDHQIRVLEARGALWFPYADVCGALGLKPKAHLLRSLRAAEHLRDDSLGETLSVAGLTTLFGRSSDRTTLRFLNWAERDVCRPWRNKRDHVIVDQASRSSKPTSVAGVTPVATPRS